MPPQKTKSETKHPKPTPAPEGQRAAYRQKGASEDPILKGKQYVFWQLATKHDCQKNLIIGHCMFAETCRENSKGPTDRKEADGWRLSQHCFTVTPACGEQYFLLGDFSGSQKDQAQGASAEPSQVLCGSNRREKNFFC